MTDDIEACSAGSDVRIMRHGTHLPMIRKRPSLPGSHTVKDIALILGEAKVTGRSHRESRRRMRQWPDLR